MMASFLTDLAKTYVEKLINGVIAESSYICCFTCIANDFEEERSRLEIESTTVKQRVHVATSRGEVIQANALFWEKEADELIQEDTKTKQKCLFGFCPHIIWRYKKGKELTNKKEQIKRLIENGKDLVIGLPAPLPDVERYSSRDYISFESRKSKYKELFDALKDDNSYITGLQGMGGTGKTTMAKEVGKELKQFKQFTYVIDTTVSLSPDIRKIQDDIAGPLGLKFDDCGESDRPKKLWSRLTNRGKIDQNEEKKILLILDDVWDVIDFDKIGIPDNHKDCRILVTTRNLYVCNRLGCNKTIQLEVLSDEEAWTMFQRHAGLKEMSPASLLDKGRKIANECKGLPVAIVVIASSLKGIQNPKVWDGALKSLQKPMHGVDEEVVKIYKCLHVSYDNMKNENAMRLFLLCSVFREDEKIYTKRLTRLGIGGGLFGDDFDSYDDARNQVVISTNKLLEFCLLLEAGRDQSILRMHDLVRDAAQWTSREFQRVKLYDKYQKARVEREMNIKYLLCEGKPKDVFSFKLDGSKLEILIVIMHKDEDCQNVKIEVPNSFFENITGLRVFHLIYDHYPNISLSLPHSVQSMKNIRSLLFERVNLGCSSLEELYFTGSFNDFCKEITFPKLRRFNIDEYSSSVDESSSKCVSVLFKDKFFLTERTLKYCMQEAEVLALRRIEGEWKNIIPEIVPMDQGMNDIVELRLGSISQLQCLIDTKHTESQVSKVFSKLVVLELWNQDNLEELFNGPLSFDSLKSLKELSISDCKHLKSLFKCNLNLFNLKSVLLKGCPMLISLLQLSTAVSLVLLETLEIIDCELLENIIIDERKGQESRGEIVDDNDNTSHGSMFQKLKVLSIKKCPRIELILPFHSPHDLPTLESITIKSCDKLQYIFGKDVKLGSLKKMMLDGIPNLIHIFPECNRTMASPIKKTSSKPEDQSKSIKCNMFSWTDIYCCGKKYGNTSTKIPLVSESKDQQQDNLMELSGNVDHFLSLERLIVKNNSKVESIICINEINEQQMNLALKDIDLDVLPAMTCLFVGPKNLFFLQNLTHLKIMRCEKLKIVFSTSIIRYLPQLLILRIEECKELKHIIEDDLENKKSSNFMSTTKTCFPKLKMVVVVKCNKLKYVFPISVCKELPELYYLIIREADELEEIFVSEGDDHKVEIPNLKVVIFENLPSLNHAQGIQFQDVKHRFIQNCQKLSLTSAITADFKKDLSGLYINIYGNIYASVDCRGANGGGDGDEKKKKKVVGYWRVLLHQKKNVAKTCSTNSPTKNEPPIQVSEISVEEGTTSANAKRTTASSQECGDCQIVIPSQDVDININDDQVSVNDDAVIKVKEQLSKDVEFKVPESIIPLPQEFQTPSMLSGGDPSQNVEDLSSSLFVKSELEQLVSKNHLDYENLSLLTGFLVKNPSVRLKDNSLRNRFKGCAYNLLAELLKFLETHSVLDVLGSCHSEFVDLLLDARNFGFDKDWLDSVERRAMFPDIQISQDAMQKLLDSKQQITKEVEVLHLKIEILSQHVEDLKHQLTSSKAVLKNIIQQEAVLSAPIGY
ncbi:putative P-loop containing nucleoside triphosphate hydrolase, leucine-rich repeat domain, L [Medicago truncatula]|uniref:Putative P-loop containing nucleoside triphosphate hydrolase, leucine-rich repeat domain, L n=1 Tax=Medicago truncatula TaxID=3880 RepID=A0A396IRF6_MEDTR|nr:putative P-loop containing nucleoside triphosphate hydrolase, leucine-rich repeat domain, L [Medicago truncatula]